MISKIEREAQWSHFVNEVEEISRNNRTVVDEWIKPLVVALRAHRFPTLQSCEGYHSHIGGFDYDYHAIVYPRVKIGIQVPDSQDLDWQKIDEERLVYKRRLTHLLWTFYMSSEVFSERSLIVVDSNRASFELINCQAGVLETLSGELQKQMYYSFIEEMKRFAGFLKEKFMFRYTNDRLFDYLNEEP